MSGIEIAGIVLGVVPLIIWAIEKDQTITTARTFFKHHKVRTELVGDLRVEWVFVNELLKYALESITTDQEYEAMTQDLSCQLWSDPRLEQKLEESFGGFYKCWKLVMENKVRPAIYKVAEKLDVDKLRNESISLEVLETFPRDQSPSVEAPGLKTRIRFSLRAHRIKTLLDSLHESRVDLQRATSMGEKSSLKHQQSSRGKQISRVLQRIHRHAENLYGALSLAWICDCRKTHQTALQLDDRHRILSRKSTQSQCS